MATEVMTAPEGRIIHKTYAVLSGAAIPQRVHVTQYDESLPVIACTLYKDGQLYTIPDGASVRLRMNKNGLPVYHEAIGIDDARHVVYLEITAQMTVLYGEFAMVIEVETSDGKTAGTSYLRLIVRQNPVQNPDLDNIPDYTANSNRLTAEGVKKLQDESSTQQKAIEDKGKNTLESIPEDYSTLSGKVDENTSGISELKEDLDTISAKQKRITFELSNGDIADDGSISQSTTYGVTELIDVKYVLNNYIHIDDNVSVYIAQYRVDESYISIKKYSVTSIISLDKETKYVRLNLKLENVGKFYLAYNIVSENELNERFDSVANISHDLTTSINLKLMFISGVDTDGDNDYSNPNWSTTDYVLRKLIDGSEIVITDTSCTIYFYLYDVNKKFIERIMLRGDNYAEGIVKFRNDCKYIRLSTKTVNIQSDFFHISSKAELVTMADVDKNISKKCVLSLNTTLDFGTFDDAGNYVRSTYEKITPRYISVGEKTKYKATFDGNLYCYEYDDDKKFVSKTTIVNGEVYPLTARTKYIRFKSDHNTDWTGEIEFENLKNIEFSYNERYGYDTLPFVFQFYGNKGLDYDGSNIDIDTKPYYTGALLRLPPNYTSNGDKVPLIYFAHGSGDYLDRNETEFSKYYMNYIQYLQDEGFAIVDINGNTSKYTTTGACQWGNPTNMAAIKQGIKWVCRNYNVDINQIYVMSKSLGGLQAINMCYENDMHIKACCPLAPELDMLCDGLGYYPNERKNNADDLGFSDDVNNVLDTPYDKSIEKLYKKSEEYKQYIRENATKLLGHNPAWRGVIGISASEMVEYPIQGDYTAQGQKMSTQNRVCVVPTKIFIAPDDTAVSYEMSKGYIQSLKNGGSVGELRTMPTGTGGHHAVDNDENALKVDTITTYCGVVHHDVPLAYVEVVQFFKRYS